MKIKSTLLVIIASLFFITGCSTSRPRVTVLSGNQNMQAAETELADAADSVSKSLQELAEIEKATT
ncbi:MAG: hypothetical protein M1561_08430, partial [Gammaproteobacteria bacterium]|nr:hypothetical protein [Gammaproteobacteria bacterium]